MPPAVLTRMAATAPSAALVVAQLNTSSIDPTAATAGDARTASARVSSAEAAIAPRDGAGEARTSANAANGAAAAETPPIRIGLLLPLRSEALGQAAAAVRAGFLAAWERDRDGISVQVIETNDVAQDILSAYAGALAQQDMMVGPLSRSAVGAVAASALVSKPTIALNYPEHGGGADTRLPPQMLAMGLSIEEEARQAAQWAGADHPGGTALVVLAGAQWQKRIASAFAAQWQRLGRPVKTVELSAPNGYLSDIELGQLRAKVQAEPPAVLFAALGADQARQLRGAIGTELPVYGTSAINSGNTNNFPTQELDGVRLLDLPWQLQRDHPAVMVYPHPASSEGKAGAADLERLYALGIDAFRVAREIAQRRAGHFLLDGVTGRLAVSFGQGAASFERTELPAVYKNGVAQPVLP